MVYADPVHLARAAELKSPVGKGGARWGEETADEAIAHCSTSRAPEIP